MESVTVRCSCGRQTEDAPCLRGGARGLVALGEDGTIRLQCDDECEEQRRLIAFAAAIGTTPTSLSAMRKVGKQSGGIIGDDGRTVYARFLLDFASRNAVAVSHFERELAAIVAGKSRKVDFGPLPQLYRVVVHSLAELHLLDSTSSGSSRHATRRVIVCHRGAGTKPVTPIPSLAEAASEDELKRRDQNSPIARSLLIYVRGSGQSCIMSIEARVKKELATHASSMKIMRREVMSEAPNCEEGVVVEFSTAARTELAFSLLKARPGVFVSRPRAPSVRPPNARLAKTAGPSSAHETAARESPGTNSWDPAGMPQRLHPSALPIGSVGVGGAFRVVPGVHAAIEDAPESWEDS
jgi:hypothetical protein